MGGRGGALGWGGLALELSFEDHHLSALLQVFRCGGAAADSIVAGVPACVGCCLAVCCLLVGWLVDGVVEATV